MIETWALLETGSEVTLVKGWIVYLLEICGIPTSISLGTVVGLSSKRPSQLVEFQLSTPDDDLSFDIESALVLDSFDFPNHLVDYQQLVIDWPHLASVPLRPGVVKDVSIVIGLDYPGLQEILDQRTDRLNPRAPHAVLTLVVCYETHSSITLK